VFSLIWPTRLACTGNVCGALFAGASYYMTFLNVVIGYGIIASVMTTDIDLSKKSSAGILSFGWFRSVLCHWC
jgi:KDO II ethanolaminephosphotransferase